MTTATKHAPSEKARLPRGPMRRARPGDTTHAAHERTPAQMTPAERGKRAYELYQSGRTWAAVAEALDFSAGPAAYNAALRYRYSLEREGARAKILAELEQLYTIVAPRAAAGNAHAQEQLMCILAQQIRIGGFDQDSPLAASFLAQHPVRPNTPKEDADVDDLLRRMATRSQPIADTVIAWLDGGRADGRERQAR